MGWGPEEEVVDKQREALCSGQEEPNPFVADTCLKCVKAGRSWQIGECNPSQDCAVADAGCFQTEKSCSDWDKQQQAQEVCKKQKSCSECVNADSLCGWWVHGSDDDRCFMSSDYWGPAEDVVDKQREALCSGQEEPNPFVADTCLK